MRAKWLVVSGCLLVVMFVAFGCATPKTPASKVPAGYEKMTIVGSSIGGTVTASAIALAKILHLYYPEIGWSSCSGATSLSPIQLTDGIIKLAMFQPTNYVDAFGADKIPQSRLRSLARANPILDYVFLIPADKPWKDITEVPKGTNLSPGTPATTVPVACEAWLKVCGLSKDHFNWLPLGKGAMAEAWRAGKIDVAFGNIDSPAPWLIDMATSPHKFKPMGLTEAQLQKAKAERTFEKLGFLTPGMGDLTKNVPEYFTQNVNCVKNPMFLISRDDFPEDIAYKMTKVFDEHRQEMAQTYRGLQYTTPQGLMEYAATPLAVHPGVLKYFKEKGYLK